MLHRGGIEVEKAMRLVPIGKYLFFHFFPKFFPKIAKSFQVLEPS